MDSREEDCPLCIGETKSRYMSIDVHVDSRRPNGFAPRPSRRLGFDKKLSEELRRTITTCVLIWGSMLEAFSPL